jgi:hypothetical protein
MARREKASLLLLLLLSSTACQTWKSVSLGTLSPAEFIEAEKPAKVRVFLRDAPAKPTELVRPYLEGSTLRAIRGEAVPIADILGIELYRYDLARSVGALFLASAGFAVVFIAALLIDCPPNDYTC